MGERNSSCLTPLSSNNCEKIRFPHYANILCCVYWKNVLLLTIMILNNRFIVLHLVRAQNIALSKPSPITMSLDNFHLNT